MSTKAKAVKEVTSVVSFKETDPETSEKPVQKDPKLNDEQKNQILLLQRQILGHQVNIHRLQKELDQLGPALNGLINKIVADLNIDGNQWIFDLDNLQITRKN